MSALSCSVVRENASKQRTRRQRSLILLPIRVPWDGLQKGSGARREGSELGGESPDVEAPCAPDRDADVMADWIDCAC